MSFVRINPATQQAHVDAAYINPTSYFSTCWLVNKMADTRRYARGKLLDIGCSSKPYRSLFNADMHIGIDWPQTVHQNIQIDVFADASMLPFLDQAFETILCTEVLEHLRTPQQALMEMSRVAAVGAHLILSVPFTFRIHEEPHDFFRYTPFALHYLLEQSGFEVIELNPRGGTLSVLLDILFRSIGALFNRLFKAIGLSGQALHVLQMTFIVTPQWAFARLIFALHRQKPRLARQFDPSEAYTLGYVVVAKKADVRNCR